MNLLLLRDRDFVRAGVARVEDERVRHVAKILEKQVGDELKVGILGGGVGRGQILAISKNRLDVEVHLDGDPPARLAVDLVLALPRPKFVGRILQAAASFGVESVTLLQTARVQKSYWQSSVLEPDRIDRHLRLGLEQAADTVPPEIELRHDFRRFVESELPERLANRPGLVAHGEAPTAFPRQVPLPGTLIVGPEGGFLPHEIESLVAAGATTASLGSRILRVEVALAVCLSRCLPDAT